MELFNEMEPLLKTFWYVAIPASIIFIVQSVMTFMGTDSSEGLEADFDSNFLDVDAPFQLFSLRNLINFLLGFSWAGISFYASITNPALLIGLALLTGSLFVYLFFIIIRQLRKLAENNSFNIQNTIGKTAEVYLTIPARKSGKGKVIVSVKGSYHELPAITTGEKLETTTLVQITAVDSDSILIVKPL
jgi:hypothetical protein